MRRRLFHPESDTTRRRQKVFGCESRKIDPLFPGAESANEPSGFWDSNSDEQLRISNSARKSRQLRISKFSSHFSRRQLAITFFSNVPYGSPYPLFSSPHSPRGRSTSLTPVSRVAIYLAHSSLARGHLPRSLQSRAWPSTSLTPVSRVAIYLAHSSLARGHLPRSLQSRAWPSTSLTPVSRVAIYLAHSSLARGHLPRSLQSRARSRISLTPVSHVSKKRKGLRPCSLTRLHMRFLMRFWCDFDAILVAIFDAISNRMCKLPAISWRFHGDLSPRNRRRFEPAQIQMRFCGDFEAKTVLPYPPRVFCRDGGKQ